MPGSRVLLFGAVFAAVLAALRIAVLWSGAGGISLVHLSGILLGACGDFVYGTVIGYLAGRVGGRTLPSIALGLAVAVLVLVKIASYHYEAVFGRMPNAELFFYLDQLSYISSSINANLPPLRVALELILVCGVLLLAARSFTAAPSRTPRGVHMLLAAPVIATGILLNTFPRLVPEALFWGTREPVIWLLQSAFVKEDYELAQIDLDPADFDTFLRLHGRPRPGPMINPAYPLCRLRPAPATAPNDRSVVILMLENAGYAEFQGAYQGQPLMPELRRIARENLSFSRARAPGIKSVSTLTALFSGLPIQPFNYYLWETPLPELDGIPRMLRDRGYRTAYFHGADLAFERQRQYLDAVGFQEIHDPAGGLDGRMHGWGYDDRFMFGELRAWLERRQAEGDRYLAALATLSSHDPYVLPPDWEPVFSSEVRTAAHGRCCSYEGEDDSATALRESLRFLDAQLGAFYRWYRALDDPPLLVIVGDHAPHLVNDHAPAADRKMRFDVPLIIAGLDEARLKEARRFADRPAGLHDVPSTLLPLLGLRAHECVLGADLLLPEAEWPAGRFLYAAGPESLERIHLWHHDGEYVYNRVSGELAPEQGPGAAREIRERLPQVHRFLELTLRAHYFLLKRDAYFLPVAAEAATALPDRGRVFLIAAHRGNTGGPSPAGQENSATAFDTAVEAGFEWIEVDVQLTRDGVPVVFHDPVVEHDGKTVPLHSLELAELRALPGMTGVLTLQEALGRYGGKVGLLVDLKPQASLQLELQLSRAVVRLISDAPQGSRVVVDSFSEFLANSVKHHCRCEVGLDTPYREYPDDALLRHVREMNLDWIYVHHSVVDASLIRRAHRAGLKVMAYTVNEPGVIARWKAQGQMPDGIITDERAVLAARERDPDTGGGER